MLPRMATIAQLHDLPTAFAPLRRRAEAEGFAFLTRLADRWRDGRYDDDAHATLRASFEGAALVAIGAQTFDEYDPAPAHRRIRHFYVNPDHRRTGVGRALAAALIEDAFALAPRLHLRATHALSTAFWDALGFQRVDRSDRSHEMVRRA